MKSVDTFAINEISRSISSFAIQAILYEMSCDPSPGLVSPISNGAHKDMNYFTFLDSAAVLSKYLALFVQSGYTDKNCKEIFLIIRDIGIQAEKDMFIKTNGVNTHKGMLFLMGVACAAVGKAVFDGIPFSGIQQIIKDMTDGIVKKELASIEIATGVFATGVFATGVFATGEGKNDLSHGEKLYLKYKNEGIRGEAERGIPTVFDYSLGLYKQNTDLSTNDRLVHTLIGIISQCDDSTILHRHNPETLEKVKEKAKAILENGGMKTACGRDLISQMCDAFIKENISPGGSADLLAITVFLSLVEQYMESISTF